MSKSAPRIAAVSVVVASLLSVAKPAAANPIVVAFANRGPMVASLDGTTFSWGAPPPPAAKVDHVSNSPAASVATKSSARPTGFVVDLTFGAAVLGGHVANGIGVGAIEGTASVLFGYYVSPHVGLFAGAEIGYGELTDGCAGDCTNAYSIKVPLRVQYAAVDRHQGAYVEGGINLVNLYGGSTDSSDPSSSPESLRMSGPVELSIAGGWRIPTAKAPADKATSGQAIDIHASLDVGQFTHVTHTDVNGEESGTIQSSERALHYAVGVAAGYHFNL